MGRGKLEMKRIENTTNRQVTFSKRRAGLFKKADQLSVLCDAQIGLIIFSSTGKMSEFCSQSLSMDQIIQRYQHIRGTYTPEQHNRVQMQNELENMRRENQNLQLSLQRYTGDDLSFTQYEDTVALEKQLESALQKVRSQKFKLLQQQTDNLRRKEKWLEEENSQIYHRIQEKEVAWDHIHQQAAMPIPKLEAEQRFLLDQFPFTGEEQPSSVLQLACLSPHLYPYRLQPTQPNLQDFNLSLHQNHYE